MPEAIMQGQSLITKTKTRTRTKVGVVALALFIGTGMMAGIGTLISSGNVCNVGSRAGLTCRTNLDCRVRSTDATAQCVGSKTLPDLIVQSVTFDPVTHLPNVSIKNQGLGSAQWGTPAENTLQVNVQWMPSTDDARYAPGSILGGATTDSTITALGPGASINVSFNASIHPFLPDARRARICVDTGTPGVLEINESNNCWEGPVTLPDLTVQSVTFDPTTRMPTVTVLNQTLYPAQWGTPATNTLQVNMQWLPSVDNTRYAPGSILGGATTRSFATTLRPRAFTIVTFTDPSSSIPADARRVRICVDTGTPGVLESNETNNCWEGQLPLPDLAVQSVTFDQTTRMPTVVIINQGDSAISWSSTDSGSPQFMLQVFNASGIEIMTARRNDSISALAPDATRTAEWSPASMPTTAVRMQITLDTQSQVTESNETNNVWEGNIPPLVVESVPQLRFTLHPASPSGSSTPGINEVLRFNVSASGGDIIIRTIQIGVTGRDGAGTRWPENDSFRFNWHLYDANDLSYPIDDVASFDPISWDGSTLWLTLGGIGFGRPDLLITSGTTRTLVLKTDTTGASPVTDDTVRFDVQRSYWSTRTARSSGGDRLLTGAGGAPLVIGNVIGY